MHLFHLFRGTCCAAHFNIANWTRRCHRYHGTLAMSTQFNCCRTKVIDDVPHISTTESCCNRDLHVLRACTWHSLVNLFWNARSRAKKTQPRHEIRHLSVFNRWTFEVTSGRVDDGTYHIPFANLVFPVHTCRRIARHSGARFTTFNNYNVMHSKASGLETHVIPTNQYSAAFLRASLYA